MVEERLGFTIEQLHSVYARRGGPLPRDLRPLRDAIDARLLAFARDGGNLTGLAECCGLGDSTVDAAVRRAKAAQRD